MTNKDNGREIALGILLAIDKGEMKSHEALLLTLNKYQYLDKKERAKITRTVEGVLERQITLDYVINQHASLKVKKMKPFIRCLLRCAVYEIYYMDAVPDRAAISEAVEMAKNHSFKKLSGFVNGVLRNIARSKGQEKMPKDRVKNLSVTYAMPEEILREWIRDYGEETAVKMSAAALKTPPLTVRPVGVSLPEVKDMLEKEGVSVTAHPYGGAWNLENVDYLSGLKSFQEGRFTIQDGAGILAVNMSGIKKTDAVLDVCAAPGGKALHASEKAKSVLARDVSDYKVHLIQENAERLGRTNLQAEVFDARNFDPASKDSFDVVICDLPCSGLGVLGRKADIKTHYTKEMGDALVALQREILDVAKRYVKKGGTLLYATCTVRRAENQDQVEAFLKDNPDFALCPFENVPESLKAEAHEGMLQLLPGVHPSDGFFMARLKRKGEA